MYLNLVVEDVRIEVLCLITTTTIHYNYGPIHVLSR